MKPMKRSALLPFICVAFVLGACDNQQASNPPATAPPPGNPPASASEIPLPKADQRLCTGVVILIDTSGSMGQSVTDRGGSKRPKFQIAGDALRRIIAYTGEWKKAHPDRALQWALFSFSISASPVLPMGDFELDSAQAAIDGIRPPGGNTAIGEAIVAAFKALYQSGCTRKHIVCITDGENTAGTPPDRVARQLYAQTHGEVEMHFVAFDTSSEHFGFLSGVNGHVVEAADGEQLQARLSEIYEKRILAETMPAEKGQ